MSLSKIALNLDITDQTGKRNKDIVRAYGKKVFEIMENTLVVKITYNHLAIDEPKREPKSEPKNEPKNYLEDAIIELIKKDYSINKTKMASKLNVSRATINEHIKNIMKEELNEVYVSRKFGKTELSTVKTKPITYYNLDVILSVGYE